MLRGSRPAPTQDRPPWWLAGATRLLLLAEGLGWWAVLIVATLHNGRVFLYWAYLLVPLLLGPALLCGIPAVVIALRPTVLAAGRRTSVFLVVNTVGAITSGALAFSQPDPIWYYTMIAAVTVGATVLLRLGVIRVTAKVAASAVAAAVILVGYAATYALPVTLPPAAALHFKGVLIIPGGAAGTVTPEAAGEYHFDKVDAHGTPWEAVSVWPGTYRYAQDCNGIWDQPIWTTVQVPWGAVVRAKDLCPLRGTVSGYASWTPCQPGPVRACSIEPYAGRRIGFRRMGTDAVYEVTTDIYGNYSVLLPPGSYTVRTDLGYVLVGGQQVVTVERGRTTHLDLAFQFG
jgi:hypothetical protein